MTLHYSQKDQVYLFHQYWKYSELPYCKFQHFNR